jgi:hypothetical protein
MSDVLIDIQEEYGYQHWWLLCTEDDFAEVCRRWQTMKNLSCLVPIDLVFPGARGQFNQWPPEAACKSRAENARVVRAHVHQCDDSWLDDITYNIPTSLDESDDSFEIDGVVYTSEQIMSLLNESRAKRTADYFTLHPEDKP